MVAEHTNPFRPHRLAPLLLCSLLLISPVQGSAAGESSYAQEIRRLVLEDKVYLLETVRAKALLPGEKLIIDALLTEDGPRAIALYQQQLSHFPDPILDPISSARIAAYQAATESANPLPELTIPDSAPKSRLKPANTVNAPIARKAKQEEPSQLNRTVKGTERDTITIAKKNRQPATSPEPATAWKAQQSAPARDNRVVPEPVGRQHGSGNDSYILQCGSFKNQDNARTFAETLSREVPVTVSQEGEFYRIRVTTMFPSREAAAAAAAKLSFQTLILQAKGNN